MAFPFHMYCAYVCVCVPLYNVHGYFVSNAQKLPPPPPSSTRHMKCNWTNENYWQLLCWSVGFWLATTIWHNRLNVRETETSSGITLGTDIKWSDLWKVKTNANKWTSIKYESLWLRLKNWLVCAPYRNPVKWVSLCTVRLLPLQLGIVTKSIWDLRTETAHRHSKWSQCKVH